MAQIIDKWKVTPSGARLVFTDRINPAHEHVVDCGSRDAAQSLIRHLSDHPDDVGRWGELVEWHSTHNANCAKAGGMPFEAFMVAVGLGDETTSTASIGRARDHLKRFAKLATGNATPGRLMMAQPLLRDVLADVLDMLAEQMLRPALDAGASRHPGEPFVWSSRDDEGQPVGVRAYPDTVTPFNDLGTMALLVQIGDESGSIYVSRDWWKAATPEAWADTPTLEPATPYRREDAIRLTVERLRDTGLGGHYREWADAIEAGSPDPKRRDYEPLIYLVQAAFMAGRESMAPASETSDDGQPDTWAVINAELVRLMIRRDNGTATAGDMASLGGLQAYALERQRAIMGIPADPEPFSDGADVWAVINRERYRLSELDIAGTATTAERAKLAALQNYASEYVHEVAPRPTDELERLERLAGIEAPEPSDSPTEPESCGCPELLEAQDMLATLEAENLRLSTRVRALSNESGERQDLLRETAKSLRSYLPGQDI